MLKISMRFVALWLTAFCFFTFCVPVAYADEITDEPAAGEEVVEETPEATEDTGTETTTEETGETETEPTTEETEETGEETTSSGSSSSEPTVVYIQVPAEDELPDDLYQSYVLGCLFFFVVVIVFYFSYKLFAMFF